MGKIIVNPEINNMTIKDFLKMIKKKKCYYNILTKRIVVTPTLSCGK